MAVEHLPRPNLQIVPHDRVLGLFYPALGLVSYHFDWRKYGQIDGPIHNNRTLVEEYGTIHHEIYHYLQLISTSYCYYLFTLEQSKALAYAELIRTFARRFGAGRVRLPLWALLNLPQVGSRLNRAEREIRDTRFQHGNSAQVVQELLHKGTRLAEVDPAMVSQAFRFATDGLRQLCHSAAPSQSSRVKAFLHEIEAGIPLCVSDEAGVRLSGEMVLENAAFIISTYPFWHDDAANPTALVLETIQHFGTTFYTRLIELTARALDIKEAAKLRKTFLTLCHLALSLPVVAEGQDRPEPVHWVDIHPGWRFIRALSIARGTKPIAHYERDYAPFVGRICNRLHWQTPTQVASRLADAGVPPDPETGAWMDSEVARVAAEVARVPWRFFDPGDDLFLASDWIAANLPPMVEDTAHGNFISTRRGELGMRALRWYLETKIPTTMMLEPSADIAAGGLGSSSIGRMIGQIAGALQLRGTRLRALSPDQVRQAYEAYAKRRKHYRVPFSPFS